LPKSFDTIASWHNGHLVRISNSMQRLMLAAHEEGILLAIDGMGNFIFPDFQPAVDGMLAAIRLLEYMTVRQMPLSQIIQYLPPVYMAKAFVPCGWESKGRVMRLLHNFYKDQMVENVDGLKIHINKAEWVHLSPNPDKPQFEVLVEAIDQARADQLVAEYQQQIEKFVAVEVVA
jgi:mannose-1-phosphate guanylyltransferase/phosphomannomutase